MFGGRIDSLLGYLNNLGKTLSQLKIFGLDFHVKYPELRGDEETADQRRGPLCQHRMRPMVVQVLAWHGGYPALRIRWTVRALYRIGAEKLTDATKTKSIGRRFDPKAALSKKLSSAQKLSLAPKTQAGMSQFVLRAPMSLR